MPFKMSKEQIEQREVLSNEYEEVSGKLEEELDKLADLISTRWNNAIQPALDALNEKRQEVYGFLDEIIDEMREEFEGKSDKWKEGDAGTNVDTWLSMLEEGRDAFTDQVGLEFPDRISVEMPDISSLNDLEPAP